MANIKKFTDKELEEILNNPFVLHATHSKIRFTIEFKEAFWKKALNCTPYTGQIDTIKLYLRDSSIGMIRNYIFKRRKFKALRF